LDSIAVRSPRFILDASSELNIGRLSRSHAPRGNACQDAPRPALNDQPICRTRSVQTGIPTRSVGTRNISITTDLIALINLVVFPVFTEVVNMISTD
jgi:hypothetical protein